MRLLHNLDGEVKLSTFEITALGGLDLDAEFVDARLDCILALEDDVTLHHLGNCLECLGDGDGIRDRALRGSSLHDGDLDLQLGSISNPLKHILSFGHDLGKGVLGRLALVNNLDLGSECGSKISGHPFDDTHGVVVTLVDIVLGADNPLVGFALDGNVSNVVELLLRFRQLWQCFIGGALEDIGVGNQITSANLG